MLAVPVVCGQTNTLVLWPQLVLLSTHLSYSVGAHLRSPVVNWPKLRKMVRARLVAIRGVLMSEVVVLLPIVLVFISLGIQ